MKKIVAIGIVIFCLWGIGFMPSINAADEIQRIGLSAPEVEKGVPLMKALLMRQSQRFFKTNEIPLQELSNILWAARGINRKDAGFLTAPTACNLQEIDVYVARKDGLYLYDAAKNALEPVLSGDIRAVCGYQEFTQVAPVNLIYVSDYDKMTGRDKQFKEFYSATDAGFVSQNVYLYCASEGFATVVLGWIDKPALKEAMKLGENKNIVLSQPIGYPIKRMKDKG